MVVYCITTSQILHFTEIYDYVCAYIVANRCFWVHVSRNGSQLRLIFAYYWLICRSGGTILSAILGTEKSWRQEFEISALVRTEQQATKLSQIGVHPVLFESFDETEKLRRIAEDFDGIV